MIKDCKKFKGGYCPIVKMNVPKHWCEDVCKGSWDGKSINTPETQNYTPPASLLPYQELPLMEMGKNFAGAVLRFGKGGFKLVSKEEFIERQVCCTTCHGFGRCPYCGCLLDLKARLDSEKGCPNKETYPKLTKYPPRNYWSVCKEKTSVIIASRGETDENLNRTIKSLFDSATGQIEVLVILDGSNNIIEDGRVKKIKFDKPRGRRKVINYAVNSKKLTGDYIFIVDSHCKMSQGWDTKLKCACGEKDIAICKIRCMDENFEEITAGGEYGHVYLNPDLVEKWWARPTINIIEPTMAFTGCGWMIRRDNFLQFGGYDESLGEYGQDGPEWSLKIQCGKYPGQILLRSDVICWHIFGTNTDNKLYPSKITPQGNFKNKMMDLYGSRLQGLVRRFNPPEWKPSDNLVTIITATDNSAPESLLQYCRESLTDSTPNNRIIRIKTPEGAKRTHLTYYGLLLSGLLATDAENIYIAEHDCLYNQSRFDFVPSKKDVFYYQSNIACLTRRGWIMATPNSPHLSTLICNRELLIESLKERTKPSVKFNSGIAWAEPGFGDPETQYTTEFYTCEIPIVDIRHGGNFTGDRTAATYLEEIPYWGYYKDLWKKLGVEL